MDKYEEELEYYDLDDKKDKQLEKAIQNGMEIIIPICAAVAGLISKDMYVTYNFALFMYFISTINLRCSYSKIMEQYLHNKIFYYTFLKNKGDGVDIKLYKMASIEWDNAIDRKIRFKKNYALILSFIYVITPIMLFSFNHLISSVIDLSALWIYYYFEIRRYNAAKKMYTLGNNLFLKYEQHTKKD